MSYDLYSNLVISQKSSISFVHPMTLNIIIEQLILLKLETLQIDLLNRHATQILLIIIIFYEKNYFIKYIVEANW